MWLAHKAKHVGPIEHNCFAKWFKKKIFCLATFSFQILKIWKFYDSYFVHFDSGTIGVVAVEDVVFCAVMCWILHVVEHEQESMAHRRCDRICQKSHIRFLTHYGAATCHSCMYMHSARYKLNGEKQKSLSYKCSCSKEHVFFALSKLNGRKSYMVQLLRNM
jgi:RNase P subunit RPR2